MQPHERHLWEYRWVRDLFVLLAAVLILQAAYSIRAVVLPIFIGLGLAYAVQPWVVWARRRMGQPEWLSAILVLCIGLLALGGLAVYLIPRVISQAASLLHHLPNYVLELRDWLYLHVPGLAARTHGVLGVPPGSTITAPTTMPVDAVAATAPATQPASDLLQNVDFNAAGSILAGGLNTGLSLAGTTLSFASYCLLSILIICVCFFFFTWKFQGVLAWFDQFIPARHRGRTLHILGRMDRSVSAFIRGRLIQAFIAGTIMTLGWGLVGVPYFLLLGLVCGVFHLVPYFSSVGWPTAILLCWIDSLSGTGHAFSYWHVFVAPSLVYFMAQGLDGWVIEPLVQGKATNLDPLTVMLAVIIGGSLAGLLGMMVAIPTAACVRILGQELLVPKLRAFAHPGSKHQPPGAG